MNTPSKNPKGKKLNLVGQRFGRLIALRATKERKHCFVIWECQCDCGNTALVSGSNLYRGKTESCGCLMKERLKLAKTTHGHRKDYGESKTYITWHNMLQRCFYTKNHNYKYYGALGITVCKRWYSFENFLVDMGERPEGKSIDRINPYGNYELKNCRWATIKEQNNNQRRHHPDPEDAVPLDEDYRPEIDLGEQKRLEEYYRRET